MNQKSLLALLLVLCLTLALFTGCSKTETAAPAEPAETAQEAAEAAPAAEETAPAEEEAPAAEEAPVETVEAVSNEGTYNDDGSWTSPGGITYPLTESTFTMTQIYNPNASVVFDTGDYSAALTYPLLVERTGVSWTFDMMSESAYSELINLRIASGDYPDAWGRDVGNYGSDLIGGINDEVLLDIAPLVADYAPDWNAILEADEDYSSGLYNTDLSLAQVCGRSLSVTTQGLLCRADWLEDLGLETPNNVDELTDLLYAFHDAYGTRLTLLLDSDLNCGVATYFDAQAMGFNGLTYHQDAPNSGKVICAYCTEGYVNYLTWLHDLYADGIICEDFLTTSKNNNNLEACYLNGDSAVWQDDAKYSFSSVSNDPNWDAVAFTMSLEGTHFTSQEETGGSASLTKAYISATCSDPETCLSFFNYGFTQPGMDLIALGVEGETYNVLDDGAVEYTEAITNNPDGFNSEQAKYAYLVEPWMPTDQQERVFDMSYTQPVKDAYAIWNDPKYDGCDDSMAMPTGYSTTTEENEKINERATDILTIFQEAAYKYIMGDYTKDDYYAAIDKAEAAGLADIDAIWQTVYDECSTGVRELVTTGTGMGGPM